MIAIEDSLAIQNLVHRYAIYVDTQQLDKLMVLFTEDVLFDESEIGLAPTRGLADLRAGFQSGFDALSHNFHMIGNNVITQFDGANAAGQCHFFAQARLAANGTRLNMAGYYQDQYRKSAHGEWRIASRVLVLLMPVEKIRA
ncbi:MAG: nuclear transport factor 2 family protein [Porticoccaceae bacterium]